MTEAPEPTGPNGRAHTRYTPGTPCWVSLMARDMAATQTFYAELFGWELEPGPRRPGPYVRALLDGHEVAGIGQLPPDRHLPAAWTPYLASDDVDLTAETVRLCCGTIGVGPLDADDSGRLAIGSDPSGAVFGVRQAAEHLGTRVAGVPGAPVWNELVTFETERVVKFYETLFGYEGKAAGPDGFDYVTLHLDGRPVAGVHGVGRALLRDRGPHWLTYFQATDVDGALERLTALGGRVLTPARDSAHGRVATVTDPEGARFALVQEPR
ncbi:glyoxalase/bleomycin resistance/extradiol dioxygenase family protein [Streptomyces sp. NTH33]|uniref:VOC family protein n=1 Tax=Streptomyces sp. NTH33 TaxID=1735453 RepID=UPI000DAA5C40|nr:VOC family protein [Streptomyces sp. NTH33]PZH15345.1 glyoxalase/bleomycin resistance/extradiol dioxygenase family protein [Streptomyces sp. NTH33]